MSCGRSTSRPRRRRRKVIEGQRELATSGFDRFNLVPKRSNVEAGLQNFFVDLCDDHIPGDASLGGGGVGMTSACGGCEWGGGRSGGVLLTFAQAVLGFTLSTTIAFFPLPRLSTSRPTGTVASISTMIESSTGLSPPHIPKHAIV